MTEESEIFRITNSHTYHNALKSETKVQFNHCLPQQRLKSTIFKNKTAPKGD